MNTSFAAIKEELRPLAAVTILLMVLTAVVYPLVVTGVGTALFERQANGSLLEVDGAAVGSSLLGQTFEGPAYFHGRPSAAGDGYDAASSSGSNLGPTSAKLAERLEADAAAFRAENGLSADAILPSDAVTASASGLDPHISPATALLQAERVARARGASTEAVTALVDDLTERPFLGFIGAARVNVLDLNMALDARFPMAE